MSRGIGAKMQLLAEDESSLLYLYSSFSYNKTEQSSPQEEMEGSIWIEKSCLPSPRLSTKRKRRKSGRKIEVTKRIPIEVPVQEYIQTGKIQVKNCSGAWLWIDGVDALAYRLLYKYFREYQLEGWPPAEIFLFC